MVHTPCFHRFSIDIKLTSRLVQSSSDGWPSLFCYSFIDGVEEYERQKDLYDNLRNSGIFSALSSFQKPQIPVR